jgi:hypothetical protein
VTINELPKVRDVGTFKDLFFAAYPQSDVKNLSTILNLSRKLTEISGDLNDAGKKDEASIVTREAAVLCDPLAYLLRHEEHEELLRDFSSGEEHFTRIPLNDIFFSECDFSSIDFSNISLKKSGFFQVMLDDAVLKNVDNYSENLWGGIIWWKAREIDIDLLRVLLAKYKPYALKNWSYRDDVIKQDDWETNIRRLCVNAKMTCTEQQLRAEFPKDS